MNKEELRKKAEDYAEIHAFRVPYDGSNKFYDDVDFKASKEGYLAGAEPREKRIEELTEQNTSLLTSVENLNKSVQELEKENVELIGKIAFLENDLNNAKAQIEKMKRCANCKYFYCPTSSRSEKDGKVLFHNWNKEKQAYCDCGNGEGEKYQLWEIKENDRRRN